MNAKSLPILGLVIFMLQFFTLSAQTVPSIFMDDKAVESGQIVALDVFVSNYTNLYSTAFTLKWDSLQLRFAGVDNIGLDLTFNENNFNLLNAGMMKYLFLDAALADGVTLSDNSILFTLKLEAISENEDDIVTYVSFDGLVDVVNSELEELEVDTSGSAVSISAIVDVDDIDFNTNFSATLTPNPFVKDAVVQLNIPEGGKLTWTLSEINGQLIKNGKQSVLPGTQILTLENTLFKHTGSYILKLEMDGESLTKQLIYIEP